MFCPQCGSEYVDGVSQCMECRVPLVDETPARPARSTVASDPVVVFESDRAELVAIAKSILISAEVPFGVCGEEVQDLFGYGRFPAGASLLIGGVQLVVPPADAADAKALLAELDSGRSESAIERQTDTADDSDAVQVGSLWARARPVARTVAALLLLVLALEVVFGLAANWIFS